MGLGLVCVCGGGGVHLFRAAGMLLLSPGAAEHLHQNEPRPSWWAVAAVGALV